jgi:iron complex outermembrane receptor protein
MHFKDLRNRCLQTANDQPAHKFPKLTETTFLWISISVCFLTAIALKAGAQEKSSLVAIDSTNSILPPVARETAVYKKLSLQQLMDIEVTSVSKRPEKLSETASAIQVITGEQIRRSGASSLPEALRLAGNLAVAQVDSRQWAISARGFNSTTANKMLVMIDGRTVYTPLYSGVFWDVQDTLMEDIERIEVISGPGSTLWGVNAVNGVINITTKLAKDSQGLFLEGGGGTELRHFGGFRYGGQVATNLHYRIYGKYFDRDGTVLSSGIDADDEWHMGQGGFRLDWEASPANLLTLQGDIYGGEMSVRGTNDNTAVNGGNVLGRWTHTISDDSDFKLKLYYDRTHRNVRDSFSEDLDTYDVDFQHRFPLGERNTIVWGLAYRLTEDNVGNSAALAFLPPRLVQHTFSGFVQDEIVLVKDRLNVTLGTKVEHNDYSGVEYEPTVRLSWLITARQTAWAAVSRAVRAPSRIDRDFYVPGTPPYLLAGGTNFNSEQLIAYELGYRIHAVEKVSFTVATFYNFYDELRSVDATSSGEFVLANHFKGEVWGAELSVNYQATGWWRLHAAYNYVHKTLWPTSGSVVASVREGNDPQNQFSAQSLMDLPGRFQFDITARFVDTLPSPNVPSYFTIGVRIARQFKNLELSVVGQNLLDDRHPEFGSQASRHEIERSVYGKVTWRF